MSVTKYTFELMPCNWYKRRAVNPAEIKVIDSFTVREFELVDGSFCKVEVLYDDNTFVTLDGRVSESKIFLIPETGTFKKTQPSTVTRSNWSINGINTNGDFILLRVKEIG